jgi:NADPH-dependent curcumin reductase CurA
MNRNRQWLLKERPKGEAHAGLFEYREGDMPTPKDGQLLVRIDWFSFDPTQRMWIEPIATYMPPVEIGEPVRAIGMGTVVESKNKDFPVGAKVQGVFGWADYVIADPNALSAPTLVSADVDAPSSLHLYGGTGMTAWSGIRCVADVKEGETVLVSAAAGATGSIASQLAKCLGAKVIGIAGSKEKCDWLTDQCGLDAVINYRTDNLDKSLQQHCPEGINAFFDNVGGDTLDTAFKHMAIHGRIALCGQIAHYQEVAPPMKYFMTIIVRSLRVQGFLVFNFMDKFEQARKELGKYAQAGKIHAKHDIQEGFENIPETLLRLFSGKNQGKQLLKNDCA